MFKLDNTNRDNLPADESILSHTIPERDAFLEWLSVGNAKKYSPTVCVACLDRIFEYALRKKISLVSVWDITQHSVFQPVYNKLLEAKLLRVTEKNTYKVFIVAGQLYLKFLKEKPWVSKSPSNEDITATVIEKGKDERQDKLLKPINPNDVIAWLVTQPNANGTLYLENVARSYISALRSAPQKLALTLENKDVFSCHTVAKLDALRDAFRSALNYKTINSVTSGPFSAGLAVYRRYLEHLSVLVENTNSDNLFFFPHKNIESEKNCSVAATVMDGKYLYGLRDEFRNYVRQQHPEWAESTVDMHKSDAYFLKNNDVGVSLTEALVNEEALLVARDKIRDYLRDVNKVDNFESGANGYLRTLRMFKKFLLKLPDSVTILTKDNFDLALIKKVTDVISTRFANVLFSDAEQQDIRDIIDEVQRKTNGEIKTGEIFPTDKAPILIQQQNIIMPEAVKWSFPGFKSKGVIINARAETVQEKPMFRKSLFTKRCVIPSTGFYEWSHDVKKQKYLFNLAGTEALYMAGLYNEFDGENRFVILTTDANSSMAEVHNRMPVVLDRERMNRWLMDTQDAIDILTATPPLLVKQMA